MGKGLRNSRSEISRLADNLEVNQKDISRTVFNLHLLPVDIRDINSARISGLSGNVRTTALSHRCVVQIAEL